MSYAESGDDEEDEDAFEPVRSNKTRGRALKRRRVATFVKDDDDFVKDEAGISAEEGTCRALCLFQVVTPL